MRAYRTWVPHQDVDNEKQGACAGLLARTMQLVSHVHTHVAGTHGVSRHGRNSDRPAASVVL